MPGDLEEIEEVDVEEEDEEEAREVAEAPNDEDEDDEKGGLGREDDSRVEDEALREGVERPGVHDPVEGERQEERPAVEVAVHAFQEAGGELATRAEEEAEDSGGLEADRRQALPKGDRRQCGAADGEAEEAHRGGVGHGFPAVERDGSDLDHRCLRPRMFARECDGRATGPVARRGTGTCGPTARRAGERNRPGRPSGRPGR